MVKAIYTGGKISHWTGTLGSVWGLCNFLTNTHWNTHTHTHTHTRWRGTVVGIRSKDLAAHKRCQRVLNLRRRGASQPGAEPANRGRSMSNMQTEQEGRRGIQGRDGGEESGWMGCGKLRINVKWLNLVTSAYEERWWWWYIKWPTQISWCRWGLRQKLNINIIDHRHAPTYAHRCTYT